jgi:hypothetical protein
LFYFTDAVALYHDGKIIAIGTIVNLQSVLGHPIPKIYVLALSWALLHALREEQICMKTFSCERHVLCGAARNAKTIGEI